MKIMGVNYTDAERESAAELLAIAAAGRRANDWRITTTWDAVEVLGGPKNYTVACDEYPGAALADGVVRHYLNRPDLAPFERADIYDLAAAHVLSGVAS